MEPPQKPQPSRTDPADISDKLAATAVSEPAAAAPAAEDYKLSYDTTKPLGLRMKDVKVEGGSGVSRVLVAGLVDGSQAAALGRVGTDDAIVSVGYSGAEVSEELWR